MKYYLAPMEGLTGYIFRQAHHEHFHNFDKYFTPFISPTKKKILKTRERKDVAVDNNKGMNTVPQILTNNADNFVDTVQYLKELGYTEVNLNLGCPSATVVTGHKGAGILEDPDKLNRFFDEIFDKCNDVNISVKTRLGMFFSSEFEDILKVFNRYPISEIIIHPRVREDYYTGQPDLDTFADALSSTDIPVCYNGDINTPSDVDMIVKRFPIIQAIMIGRGVLRNPGLLDEIITGEQTKTSTKAEFHDTLLNGYIKDLKNEKDVLFKMKEMWSYLETSFRDNPEHDTLLKCIRKAGNISEYKVAVSKLINEQH